MSPPEDLFPTHAASPAFADAVREKRRTFCGHCPGKRLAALLRKKVWLSDSAHKTVQAARHFGSVRKAMPENGIPFSPAAPAPMTLPIASGSSGERNNGK